MPCQGRQAFEAPLARTEIEPVFEAAVHRGDPQAKRFARFAGKESVARRIRRPQPSGAIGASVEDERRPGIFRICRQEIASASARFARDRRLRLADAFDA
jgi:hypothetical protein